MHAADLFWMFFMLSALQPLLRQRFLEASRARHLVRLEKTRKSRVIFLIHRQETMSFLGFPLMRFISIEDSEEVLRAIHLTDKEVPIDVVLHTPGGLALAALQIARALSAHPAKVTVFVPHYAMSGGTLIALAADEIVMHPQAVLGPVDPQLGGQPAASILVPMQRKSIDRVRDQTLILADIAEKAVRQLREDVVPLLSDKLEPARAEEVAGRLTRGDWTHDFPITVARARELGLRVSTDVPVDVYRLMELYPQANQRRPSVEYVPFPRHADQPPPAWSPLGRAATKKG
jgi:ClpP class serine protease